MNRERITPLTNESFENTKPITHKYTHVTKSITHKHTHVTKMFRQILLIRNICARSLKLRNSECRRC